MSGSPGAPLLDVRDLHVLFDTEDAVVHAVRGMSFAVHRGETLGLVGESGCGKSVSCLSVLRLLPPNGRIVGEAVFEGADLLALPQPDLDRIRGT
ncbi:MAG: ATP-binding cassette domain-containing protein, partial [Pseudomonadota bacterium]